MHRCLVVKKLTKNVFSTVQNLSLLPSKLCKRTFLCENDILLNDLKRLNHQLALHLFKVLKEEDVSYLVHNLLFFVDFLDKIGKKFFTSARVLEVNVIFYKEITKIFTKLEVFRIEQLNKKTYKMAYKVLRTMR